MGRNTGTVRRALVLAGVLLVPAAVRAQDADPSRLYGRVETRDGQVYEGFIRWDGNEGGWFDVLHATKAVPDRNRRDADRLGWEPEDRGRRIEVFGIGITLPESGLSLGSSAQSGIRFGHISSMEATGGGGARLLLRSGEEVDLRSGGDLGSSEEILVEDGRGGSVELDWGDVRAIDFLPAPARASTWGDRLYGTLQTRDGSRYTGYIVWDMDEIFTGDILDGEERGRDREIPFGRIGFIQRAGSDGARVGLVSGEEVVLRGSNDVDDDNRDIMVADPALGEVRVEWDAFHRVDFESPPTAADASVFSRAGRLRGTVHARGGERHEGHVRWDNDEEYGWELLDGELMEGVDLDIEMGAIRSIERIAYDASRVTLRDGRTFELTDSNDVDEGNRGIYLERGDGTVVLIPWDRFQRVVFDQ